MGAYTYLGYPVLLEAANRLRGPREPAPAQRLPSLTVLVAALDEEACIGAKIADTRRQDYGGEAFDVVVVADGSADGTARIAGEHGATVLWRPERRGKSAAVNRGMAAATTDVVVMTDANCSLAPGSLKAVGEAFWDPRVAVVSGAKTVGGEGAGGAGEGLYWRFESRLKRGESALGVTMGAPGELCGVRRSTFRPIPAGVVNDDYHLTCDALVRGLSVVYVPAARTSEAVSETVAEEFERRTRIAAGTWQTTLQHLALAAPSQGWTAVCFLSHRVLRSIVVPPLLPLLWVGAGLRAPRSRWARLLWWGQTAFYASAAAGYVADVRAFGAPFQFVFVNVATLRGAARFLRGTQPVAWRRVRRSV